MKYTGQFSNIDNKKYKVEIITNGSSASSTELTLSDSPCTLEWNGEDDNLFKPIKYSSATFEYVSDGLFFDLYAATPMQNVVKLTDSSNNIVWQGYVTPNVYDNEFDFSNTSSSIECIDGLAVLEYVDYSTIGGGAKKVVNFYEIIKHCISKSNLTYKNLYISDNVKVDNTQWFGSEITFIIPDKSYLNICYVSECNFFDEDDIPLKCSEVLEEICKYFNLTMYTEGQNIYMVDYCGIKNNVNTYYCYNLSTDSCSLVTLSNTYNIGDSTNLIETTNISIGNTYNKFSVEADIYPFENMIPDLFDEDYLTQNGDLYYDYLTDKKGYMFYMFLKNDNYKSYYYDKSTYRSVATPSTITYDTIHNLFGATLVKHSFEEYDDPGLVNSVDWTDYLLIHLHQPNGTAKYDKIKIFETNITDLDERILANYNNYLVINGTATYYDIEGYTAKVSHSRDDDGYAESNIYIPCSLCYGGSNWWNGTDWQTTECTFNLPLYSAQERKHYIGKDFNVRNNIMWYDGLESSTGRKIPFSYGMGQIANLKFTMYAPKTPNKSYRLDYIFIKNFSIKVETSKNYYAYDNGKFSDFIYADELKNEYTNDTNIIYENVVDASYIEEMDEIKNKITTFAKEQVANSTVAFTITDSTANLFYAKTIQVESLGNDIMKEEEYTINRLAEQYSTPSLILDVSLKDDIPMFSLINNTIIDSNKMFIINSKSIDLGQGITTYNLIEKK